MGRLLEFILFIIVAYFVFNFLNRLFSSSPKNKKSNINQPQQEKKNNSSSDQKINWDAETVDYEEVETKNNEKK